MSSKFKIGMIQMKIGSNPNKNIDNAIKKIRKASTLGAKIICLPEHSQRCPASSMRACSPAANISPTTLE